VPLARSEVAKSLSALQNGLRNTQLNPSKRCGVHIHINCQQLTLDETLMFIMVYLILEDLLVRYCGPARAGNPFCLRARDADALISALMESVRLQYFRPLTVDIYRYSSLNISAIAKFGTLEFRAHPATTEFARIKQWVDILLAVKDASSKWRTPLALVEYVSMEGASRFFEEVFPDPSMRSLIAPEYGQEEYISIVEGLRRVQDIAYIRKTKKRHVYVDQDDNGQLVPIAPVTDDLLEEIIRNREPLSQDDFEPEEDDYEDEGDASEDDF
jgi:hypothetical protein